MRRLVLVLFALLVAAACSSGDPSVVTAPPTTARSSTAPSATAPTATTAAATTDAPNPGESGVPEPAGAAGLGDPYFPDLGNGGYDVEHYDIDIAIDPETATIDATTTISAVATETLATFNLDFVGLEIHSLQVDGAAAQYVREGNELRVSPQGGIVAGEDFAVAVSYSGRPDNLYLESIGIDFGWTQTPEGIYVAAEPDAARTWFPGNDHPSDKATFGYRVTVPKPLTAAANGALIEVIDNGATRTFVWDLESKTATYLATVVVGDYERIESRGPDGILLRDYIPESFNGALPGAFEITADAMELFADWFGPYPFDRYGHIVVYEFGGALETQTLSLMGNRALFAQVVVHELAHQWFGDSVTPANWQEIWLNEGFATFAEFLWTEHRSGTDAMLADIRDLHTALSSIPHLAISDPTESELFGPAVYWRGGMTLHALRVELDDDALMREILRTYFERHRDGNATTQDFIDVVHELSGRELSELWDAWLNSTVLPPLR